MFRNLLSFINRLLPKFDHVIVHGSPNIEASAIEVANYIKEHYDLPVYFAVSKEKKGNPESLLVPGIRVVDVSGLFFKIKYFTAKYIFFTHGSPLRSFSKRQTVVNIWHGILYKKLGKLIGHEGTPAHHTVATSPLTRKMFSEAFGVSEESIIISGYPRNDVMLRAKQQKSSLIEQIDASWKNYNKIIIWLPTYRQSVVGEIRMDGKEVGNPFYIEDFDVNRFNKMLEEHNALCIIKPHPMAPVYGNRDDLSNLLYIDDLWLSDHGITLYHLAGVSDMLISDVSSIMIDYLLLDQPIICVSTDFEEYKANRGFYFEDIEDWIPSKILTDQQDFFEYIKTIILQTETDLFLEKRLLLKGKFFTHFESTSTKRLIKSTINFL